EAIVRVVVDRLAAVQEREIAPTWLHALPPIEDGGADAVASELVRGEQAGGPCPDDDHVPAGPDRERLRLRERLEGRGLTERDPELKLDGSPARVDRAPRHVDGTERARIATQTTRD